MYPNFINIWLKKQAYKLLVLDKTVHNTFYHLFVNAMFLETSTYLRQHAHNPVNWHPWSQETLEKAKKLKKPIFLSYNVECNDEKSLLVEKLVGDKLKELKV